MRKLDNSKKGAEGRLLRARLQRNNSQAPGQGDREDGKTMTPKKAARDAKQGSKCTRQDPSMSGRLVTDRISQGQSASNMTGPAAIQLVDAVAHFWRCILR